MARPRVFFPILRCQKFGESPSPPPLKKIKRLVEFTLRKKKKKFQKQSSIFFNAKKRPNLWEKNQGQEPDKEGKEEETQVAINP
jgi:hypothetical protein